MNRPYRVDYILPDGRMRYAGTFASVYRAGQKAKKLATSSIIAMVTRRSDCVVTEIHTDFKTKKKVYKSKVVGDGRVIYCSR